MAETAQQADFYTVVPGLHEGQDVAIPFEKAGPVEAPLEGMPLLGITFRGVKEGVVPDLCITTGLVDEITELPTLGVRQSDTVKVTEVDAREVHFAPFALAVRHRWGNRTLDATIIPSGRLGDTEVVAINSPTLAIGNEESDLAGGKAVYLCQPNPEQADLQDGVLRVINGLPYELDSELKKSVCPVTISFDDEGLRVATQGHEVEKIPHVAFPSIAGIELLVVRRGTYMGYPYTQEGVISWKNPLAA